MHTYTYKCIECYCFYMHLLTHIATVAFSLSFSLYLVLCCVLFYNPHECVCIMYVRLHISGCINYYIHMCVCMYVSENVCVCVCVCIFVVCIWSPISVACFPRRLNHLFKVILIQTMFAREYPKRRESKRVKVFCCICVQCFYFFRFFCFFFFLHQLNSDFESLIFPKK